MRKEIVSNDIVQIQYNSMSGTLQNGRTGKAMHVFDHSVFLIAVVSRLSVKNCILNFFNYETSLHDDEERKIELTEKNSKS